MLLVFLIQSPPYFLRKDISLNLELAILANPLPGDPPSSLPQVMDVSCQAWLLHGCWGPKLRSSFLYLTH